MCIGSAQCLLGVFSWIILFILFMMIMIVRRSNMMCVLFVDSHLFLRLKTGDFFILVLAALV